MKPEVVIAGAGPNGLFLAIELRRAGVETLVLEQLAEPSAERRANGLVGRVVQMLDYRGLYERLSGHPGRPAPVPEYQFAGFGLDLRSVQDHPLHVLPLPQRVLAARLAEHALELGVEIRRGHAVGDFAQDDTGVTVEVVTPQGKQAIHTKFLVGADGGHSVVRKRAGIGFPGATFDHFVTRSGGVLIPEDVFAADGTLDVPGEAPLAQLRWNRTPRGAIMIGRFEPGPFLISTAEWHQPHFDGPMTFEELHASVRRVVGHDLPIEPVPDFAGKRLTGGNARQAERYREGRVLLLGDAAHVHPSFGGPGLNLGLQDALNLGWKLAAEVRGWAPPGLLDTYEGERYQLGHRVLLHTRAQLALLSPGDEMSAVREIFGELLTEGVVRRRIAELLAGADVRYDMPSADAHPLLGRWMPDLPLEPGTRVGELLRSGRPVLLDFTGGLGPVHERVDHVRADTPQPPAPAVLIRPDGYVAWAGGGGLHEALRTWFGPVGAVV